ncbi:hypothetical protein [Streptomyces liangshanensis]|uniref:Uncharacterized protein n=1 Tax=Streptomyces liangshanensis TaxID=2717324 RepID=A0A6G9GVE2_9ACTN|nr:hypothetical protein [Streptomyces liangshanensis]QIQ02164.1 hypothetical protein HA039_07505 [Streptomyces liangshanensis]
MSKNWVAAVCAGLTVEPRPALFVKCRDARVPARAGRPAWQSPYGPPPRRAHRGRWAAAPVVARSRSALRGGQLCRRCD